MDYKKVRTFIRAFLILGHSPDFSQFSYDSLESPACPPYIKRTRAEAISRRFAGIRRPSQSRGPEDSPYPSCTDPDVHGRAASDLLHIRTDG